MPIWDAPPRRLVTLIQRLARERRAHAPAQDDVSTERVEATLPGDAALVKNRIVPVSGQTQLRAGQPVHVWNRAGQPGVILAHTARRAQFPAVALVAVGAVVEELFLAGNRSTGVFDVYFRNDDQVTPLGLSAFVAATNPPNSVPTSLLKWGQGTDRFLLRSGDTVRVFRLNRTANQAYPRGQKAKATQIQKLELSAATGAAVATWQTDVPSEPVTLPFAVPFNAASPFWAAAQFGAVTSGTDIDVFIPAPPGVPPPFSGNVPPIFSTAPFGGLTLSVTPNATGGSLSNNVEMFWQAVAWNRANQVIALSPTVSAVIPGTTGDAQGSAALSWTQIKNAKVTVYRSLIGAGNVAVAVNTAAFEISTILTELHLDERGHVVAIYRVDLLRLGVGYTRSMITDLTAGVLVEGPSAVFNDLTQPNPTTPQWYTRVLVAMRNGVIQQSVTNQNPFAGSPGSKITAVVGTEVFVLLDEPIPTKSVFVQMNERHMLWALADGNNPFNVPAQVFLRSLPIPSLTPPIGVGPVTQVGTALGTFFFQGAAATYGAPLQLLRPFDVLWATVEIDESTNPDSISKELLFPVAAWKTNDPSVITLLETDPKFPPKDTALAAITGLRKLPQGVAIVGGSVTPAVQVFQALNDVDALDTVGRRKTP